MNKQPVRYLQTDKRWKALPYQVKGETATIGGSGCGPTAAAMAIETLTGKTFTPVDACKWAVEHGYKALNQGTYYGYFVPQFKAFGIECRRLNTTNVYHKPDSPVHDEMIAWLRKGYYVIALMKKGTWTGGGHFVLVWWADNKIRINDPASTKEFRMNGDVKTFRNEAAYYWLIDARKYNGKDELDMDIHEAKHQLISCAGTGDHPSEWAKEATEFCKQAGIFNGDGEGNYGWQQPITREAVAQILFNALDKAGLTGKLL